MLRFAVLTTALAAAAFGAPAPAFEVASIRPVQATAMTPGMGQHGVGRETIQVGPDSVTMRNASLRTMTRWAYHVTEYQVTGPDWIGTDRFDLTAKAPVPATEDQLREMMQTLLADRFKMTSHRQTKEMQAFVLQVGKGGPKFKESGSGGESDVTADKNYVLTVARTPVARLVETLAGIFRAPVVDQTGLTGKYDVVLNAGKYLTEMHSPADGDNRPDPVAIVSRGLQEELGLRVEGKRMPVDLVVIEKAEKAPVEN
jgi:uncharacterized protein (TIGR03435 family)